MNKRHHILGFLLLFGLSAAWGQDNSTQQPEENNPQQPVPAFGSENQATSIQDNPPISGLDAPNLEPHAAPVSYLQAGAHFGESVDSNIQDALGGSRASSLSRALGSVELQRLWRNYALNLDYLGGVGYYNVKGVGLKQVEEMGLEQKLSWKRGQLAVRDSFSYQPEGSFGSSYGSVGVTGAGLQGTNVLQGSSGLGELGQVPRISNASLMDIVESLTPKSSVTITGGYGFLHFLQNQPGSGNSFIGSSQASGEVGYDRILGAHDQAALVYGYQIFHFSTGTTLRGHVVQLMWGHRISGRMDFLVGAGPQFTLINNVLVPVTGPLTSKDTIPPCVLGGTFSNPIIACPENISRVSASGRGSLRYRFPRLSLDLTYQHYLSNGSGFFAGAQTDVVHLDASRPLGRIWTVGANIGYTRNTRQVPLTPAQMTACTASAQGQPNAVQCPGVNANTYQFAFAGVSAHRMFGHSWHAYASYQFNNLIFDQSFCQGISTICNRISERHVGTIGLDWTPRPVRLD